MYVIVTRPSPDGEAFAAEVARLGATPVLSPAMAIRDRAGEVDLAGVETLAFTSANGVRAFSRLSPRRDFQVFAVGDATAGTARAAGFAHVTVAGGDVESLSQLIASTKLSSHVLHLAGSDRAGDLVAALAAKGVGAHRAVIYDAVKNEQLSASAKAALMDEEAKIVVVFFSPRSARLFLDQALASGLAHRLGRAVALCLSAEVAASARVGRWAAVEIAADRTANSVLALIEEMLAGRNGRTGAAR